LSWPNLSLKKKGTKEFSNLSRRFSGGKLACPVRTGKFSNKNVGFPEENSFVP